MRSSWWSMGFLWCGFANPDHRVILSSLLLVEVWYAILSLLSKVPILCFLVRSTSLVDPVLDSERDSMIYFLQLSHDHRPTHFIINTMHHNSPESSANVRCKDHTFLIPICTLRNVLTFMAIDSCRLLPSSI
ncbi:uncharacterized protein BJ212DRAFT_390222 [Suillus subaureus]|uniref:Uncharacterized protein n=1 Tax=Suillus subaureus TaxID=48587 RepID=A0A9P7IYU7_9AGAM|nr:uncharacterized protein BJ212DRAFT_390222 [Suillus subaureus]KAG1797259.1 hypothetical protein BJ212DRAFT_390222 [Suillus subaureus]